MATTQEQNARLTTTAAGTPMGDLLRRYWYPVAVTIELLENPVKKVRLLGEDLTLYRTTLDTYGLIGDRCPHRCMAMEYGIPDERGLRCAYHSWLFDSEGRCLEQPWDDRAHPEAHFRDKIKITAYPVQELGGLLFAYLGPLPAPLLPRWDLLASEDLDRAVDIQPIPCNWLQCMDNSFDPVHFEFLHVEFGNYQLARLGQKPAFSRRKHLDIAFDMFEYGVYKRRLLEGQSEESADWTVGHPVLFPATLCIGDDTRAAFQFRVPTDDGHTNQITYQTRRRMPGDIPKPITVEYQILFDENGKLIADIDMTLKQDIVAWVAQGTITDRSREHLSSGDVGIILFRKLLQENIERVARGEDPLGTIRDPAVNDPMIVIRRSREHDKMFRIGDHMEPRFWQGGAPENARAVL